MTRMGNPNLEMTDAPPEPKNTFDFEKYGAEKKDHDVGFTSKGGKTVSIKCNPNHRSRKSPYNKTQLKRMIPDHKTDCDLDIVGR